MRQPFSCCDGGFAGGAGSPACGPCASPPRGSFVRVTTSGVRAAGGRPPGFLKRPFGCIFSAASAPAGAFIPQIPQIFLFIGAMEIFFWHQQLGNKTKTRVFSELLPFKMCFAPDSGRIWEAGRANYRIIPRHIYPRIDHQSLAVPLQSARLFDLGAAEPENKQVYHRRILHTSERQRDTKQTNKCASPYEESWAL